MTETRTRSLTLVRDQEIEIENLRARVAELEPLQARVAKLELELRCKTDNSIREQAKITAKIHRALTSLRYDAERARDALEIEPPRPDFSVRYSEHAMKDIDATIQWIEGGYK